MAFRVISRLDVKAPNLVKGIHLEGLRVLGQPENFARRYYEDGADEIFYQDIVASLYNRNSILDIIEKSAAQTFVPMIVGGGIRSVEDVRNILRAGADKVSINTAAVQRPELISEAADLFGTQCIVIAIEAIRQPDNTWQAFTDNGRERTGLDVIEWAIEVVKRGAGEIVLTSVDFEGTRKGPDFELASRVLEKVNVPVLIHGGVGKPEHVLKAARLGVDGIVFSSVLHYGELTISGIKKFLLSEGVEVRI